MIFRVFVSGNQTELEKERFAVKEAIEEDGILNEYFKVFLFEELLAASKDPVSSFLEKVKKSHIYIGLLGNQYGSTDDDGLSATEKELWTFIKFRPRGEVLIYLKKTDESLKNPEILNLIGKIKDLHVYNQFKSIEDIQGQVRESLASYLKKKGYISTEPFDVRPNLKAD